MICFQNASHFDHNVSYKFGGQRVLILFGWYISTIKKSALEIRCTLRTDKREKEIIKVSSNHFESIYQPNTEKKTLVVTCCVNFFFSFIVVVETFFHHFYEYMKRIWRYVCVFYSMRPSVFALYLVVSRGKVERKFKTTICKLWPHSHSRKQLKKRIIRISKAWPREIIILYSKTHHVDRDEQKTGKKNLVKHKRWVVPHRSKNRRKINRTKMTATKKITSKSGQIYVYIILSR